MLHSTELLGGEAYDKDGHFVGHVTELFIEPADQPNRVARVLLGRGKYLPLVARYDHLAFVAPGVLKLNVEEKELEHYRPNEGWLAVRKDLLDQQIIDTSGRKVVRVNDIDFSEQRTNGTVELRVTHVDVGLTGAARRLLHGVASPGVIRGVATKLPTRVIPWEFVNLIESDPLRRVKLRITHQKLESMHPADLADIMEELSPTERQSIIASLDEETAAEALAELDKRLTSQIVETLDPEKAGEEAREVRELLKFEANSAGGMMNTDFVYVGESATCEEVIAWIQEKDVDLEQLDTIFLIDTNAKLTGAVAVGRLLLAPPNERMEALKSEPWLAVLPDAQDKEVFELFDKYNLHSLAVVDTSGHPIGAIAVDDIVTRLRRH